MALKPVAAVAEPADDVRAGDGRERGDHSLDELVARSSSRRALPPSIEGRKLPLASCEPKRSMPIARRVRRPLRITGLESIA